MECTLTSILLIVSLSLQAHPGEYSVYFINWKSTCTRTMNLYHTNHSNNPLKWTNTMSPNNSQSGEWHLKVPEQWVSSIFMCSFWCFKIAWMHFVASKSNNNLLLGRCSLISQLHKNLSVDSVGDTLWFHGQNRCVYGRWNKITCDSNQGKHAVYSSNGRLSCEESFVRTWLKSTCPF